VVVSRWWLLILPSSNLVRLQQRNKALIRELTLGGRPLGAHLPNMNHQDVFALMTKIPATVTEFILVRHGQTIWNSQGRWQGWLNSPLSELGVQQAQVARDALREVPLEAAYCSDTGRAKQTAEIILEPHGLALIEVEGLREKYYGKWEGLNVAEIDANYPGTRFDDSRDQRATHRPPDGETMVEVRARVKDFLTDLAGKERGRRVLLVAHSGVVRAVDSLCSDQRFDDIWHRTPPNACMMIFQVDDAGRFHMVKDFIAPEG